MGEWLEGKVLAEKIKGEAEEEVTRIRETVNETPGLVAILVGEDRASQIYVRMKKRTSEKLGISSEVIQLPADTSGSELHQKIEEMNRRNEVDGILVQLPLPAHLSSFEAITAIHPDKDVDGIHPVSLGKLVMNERGLRPATPTGIMELLKSRGISMEGKRVVIIGRSLIVGKPLAAMMTNAHGTVTVCHSRTRNLPGVAAEADILVAAMGRPGFVTPDFVKEGATVIDVGTSQLADREKAVELYGQDEKRMGDLSQKGYTLAGDVHPQVFGKVEFLTPVPGGVGPLTIAFLMRNTVEAYKMRRE